MERILMQTPLFKGLPPEEIRAFLAFSRTETIGDGQPLVQEGGRDPHDLFLLVEGEVEVVLTTMDYQYQNREVVFALPAPQVLGEIAAVLDHARTATIRGWGECRVVRIDGRRFRAHLDANPIVGYRVLKNLLALVAGRLVGANAMLKNRY